jgi:lipid-binding SYLF domain-containing protein
MKKILGVFFVAALAAAWVVPAHGGWNPLRAEKVGYKKTEEQKVDDTVANFKLSDPYMVDLFLQSAGYAVFPTVAKAGMGIGGAYGKGRVYKNGRFIGSVSLTQLTIGFQLGGQAYSEVIFFKDKRALEDFTEGNYEIGAQVSAVAVTVGASLDVDYKGGVAVFTLAKGGLMYEASVGGQKFSFTPE